MWVSEISDLSKQNLCEQNMKKRLPSKPTVAIPSDAMRPEYDFTGGVRGKHYKARLTGYTIKITQRDGATHVKQVESR